MKKTTLRQMHLFECKEIAKLIFRGYTNEQISEKLNYSKTTVSNRLNFMFKKYDANNKFQFMLGVFCEIIGNYKDKISDFEYEICLLKKKNARMVEFLKKLNNKLKNKNLASYIKKLNS